MLSCFSVYKTQAICRTLTNPFLGLQVIHITGCLRIRMALTHSRSVPNQIMGMVVVAHALPPPTINEVRIDCQMFVTRVNMDLKIVYCENRWETRGCALV